MNYTEWILFWIVLANFILSFITIFVRHKGVKVAEEALHIKVEKLESKVKYAEEALQDAYNRGYSQGQLQLLDYLEKESNEGNM